MSVISYIKNKVYNYFNPPIEKCLRDVAIVEDWTMTPEERERCLQLLEEWKEKHNGT